MTDHRPPTAPTMAQYEDALATTLYMALVSILNAVKDDTQGNLSTHPDRDALTLASLLDILILEAVKEGKKVTAPNAGRSIREVLEITSRAAGLALFKATWQAQGIAETPIFDIATPELPPHIKKMMEEEGL